jgi:hypothetical protein
MAHTPTHTHTYTHTHTDFGRPPSLVLVARSARDGYTPQGLVDAIQVRRRGVCVCVFSMARADDVWVLGCGVSSLVLTRMDMGPWLFTHIRTHTLMSTHTHAQHTQERLLAALEGVPELPTGMPVRRHYGDEDEEGEEEDTAGQDG